MRNADPREQWITNVRARLAARKNGLPSTKVGAVRALWPEIEQALQNGQTLKSIREWLEAEGLPLRYSQLTLYVRRIRKKQASEVLLRPGNELATQAAPDNRPAPEPRPVARDPLANLRSREGRPRTFEYNPEFKEEELL